MPQFGGASEKCHVCAKTVYLQEKIVVEDKDEKKTFHKMCLKCSHCKSTLSLGNYASMKGVFYCKPHFKQLFATKGNYDEGFGKEKLTSKWAPNAAPAASTAASFVPVEKEETSKPVMEKKESTSAIAAKFGSSEKCEKCSKLVYATEKIVVEEKDGKKVFHKNCLKCSHCQNLLSLGNYASMNGVTYCKPHFKQLFAAKGNYDEGFGKEKHANKWETTAGSAPTTFVPVEKTDSPKVSSPAVSEVANRFKGASVSDKCTACGKTVYLTERTVVEDKEDKKVFHKACLRCSHCQVVLSLGNYASMGGVMYCKPHFKQLFASRGNYDEGFGKQKHSAKWIEQDNAEQTTTTTAKHEEAHHKEKEPAQTHQEEHKEHSFATTSSSHEDTHKHEEHKHEEHKHEEHKHEEPKHEEEHKHEEHKYEEPHHEHHEEHKHEEHEHHEHGHEEHGHHEHHEHEHHHEHEEHQEEPLADDE